ncbi:hypothetical protein [Larkinella terrae]|uniref:Uncharacterized protein n=1 Tax=Larkinella terrae TaxID=2025311 RepID=A0A7K0EKR8_9BACT|nr:hypothetical protein [Larkinella terrae]MRS62312.1 hypothetical protein [Larkinella terrae]
MGEFHRRFGSLTLTKKVKVGFFGIRSITVKRGILTVGTILEIKNRQPLQFEPVELISWSVISTFKPVIKQLPLYILLLSGSSPELV